MSTSQPHFGGHGQSTREICGILWATGPPRAGRGLLIGERTLTLVRMPISDHESGSVTE